MTYSLSELLHSTSFSLDNFADSYDKYPLLVVSLFSIVKDLNQKKELTNLEIIDGSKWNRQSYFVQGIIQDSGIKRVLVPLASDAEIDMEWCNFVKLFTCII